MIAIVLTSTIAFLTVADKMPIRAFKLTLLGVVIALAALALQHAGLRINVTGSMPIGIYLISSLPADAVERGMLVTACAPITAQKVGRDRGYFAAGPCAGDAEQLLKVVAAVAGDEIRVGSRAIAVNGCPLSNSQVLPFDRRGRTLTSWTPGNYRLGKGEVWLYAPDQRSWDSRYWGPVSVANVSSQALPWLVFSGYSIMRSIEGLSCLPNRSPSAKTSTGASTRTGH